MMPSLTLRALFVLAGTAYTARMARRSTKHNVNQSSSIDQMTTRLGGKCGGTFKVVPYSTLGGQIAAGVYNASAGPAPNSDTVIMDSTILGYVQNKFPLRDDEGLSHTLYKKLHLTYFPAEVSTAVKKVNQAKLHEYKDIFDFYDEWDGTDEDPVSVIHVVGPDLNNHKYVIKGEMPSQTKTDHDTAIYDMRLAYRNVLREFTKSSKPKLRLLPIIDGHFAGHSKDVSEKANLIFRALEGGFRDLDAEEAKIVQAADIELCIFVKEDVPYFERQAQHFCKDNAETTFPEAQSFECGAVMKQDDVCFSLGNIRGAHKESCAGKCTIGLEPERCFCDETPEGEEEGSCSSLQEVHPKHMQVHMIENVWSIKVDTTTRQFYWFKELYDFNDEAYSGGWWVFAGHSSFSRSDVKPPSSSELEQCGISGSADYCDTKVVEKYHACLRAAMDTEDSE